MITGIYSIRNMKNNKRYIGQSINVKRRKKEHYTALRKGVHHNEHLQNSWNKHSESSFEFTVVETCEEEELNEREECWIKKYNTTCRHIGYNLTSGGDSENVTEDIKHKMSLIRTAKGGKIATKQFLRALTMIGEGEKNSSIAKESRLNLSTIKSIRDEKYNPEENCFDWAWYDPEVDWYIDTSGNLCEVEWNSEFSMFYSEQIVDIWQSDYYDDTIDSNELLKNMYDYQDKHGSIYKDNESWEDFISSLHILKEITHFYGDDKEDTLIKYGYGNLLSNHINYTTNK